MSTITVHTAQTDAEILDVMAERWSTRVFDPETPIDEAALSSALEAARWAPSANNTQPWRFVVARRGSDAHAAIVASLMGFNQAWAADAAALVVFATTTSIEGKPSPGRRTTRDRPPPTSRSRRTPPACTPTRWADSIAPRSRRPSDSATTSPP